MADIKEKKHPLLASHCRSARGLLDITQRDLALASGVDEQTIRRFENGEQQPRQGTLEKIRDALERRGIEFFNGGAPGVRLHPDRRIIE